MPPKHQKYSEWSPERFIRWAEKIGPQTKVLTETLLVHRAHPQQAYRTLLGILRLGKSYGEQRLEAACDRALQINALSYRSIESILKNGLDQKPLKNKDDNSEPIRHSNIRGPEYFDNSIH